MNTEPGVPHGVRPALPLLAILLVTSLLLGANLLARDTSVSAHSLNNSCYPQYWAGSPPNNHLVKFNQYPGSASYYCALAKAGMYTQYTYWTNSLTAGDPDGLTWVFMAHHSNENVHEQMDPPYCANSGTWPYCSTCGCTWAWWSYWWKTYSDGWKNQQTNTWQGGPYWHRQGWF